MVISASHAVLLKRPSFLFPYMTDYISSIYYTLKISYTSHLYILFSSTFFYRKIIIFSKMTQSSQNQSEELGAYPSPPVSTGPYVAPPPLGYPTNYTSHATVAKVETKSKGDEFLKSCLAAMLACCVLDACIF
ncbi:PREDICTED: uncharacterized protein LOC104786376 [Camelina sativa]|uniref:Uncharacterized protein LOC104786376 n=1 Tax=Camelina sativa TaxID=90675 RepID=A0ABM0Z3Y5_CAMSA|nr:PREDICTED: uncharacterized protein LOC104786376 [Camelina sativa]